MAVFVVHGSKRKKFRTRRGAAWHKRRFGGRIVAAKPKKRAASKRRAAPRRKSAKRRTGYRRRR
jgi:hypothetical protein